VSNLIPAATVILARDAAVEPDVTDLEVLMLRRNSRLAFAGGMWVFPGGRVDPDDFGDDPDDLAAAEARAAAREAHEECGLSLHGVVLERWSHWTPPDYRQDHRFSTAFFVAAAPDGDVKIDDGEIREHQWVSPGRALELHAEATVELAPPTYITLVQMSAVRSSDDLLTLAATAPTEHFHTRLESMGDQVVALYHGDAGYEDGDTERAGPRHRLIMGPGPWTYIRDAD
jgi:8-oxo-dGTP pyrophosphatase MutT (NUDIX family)